MIWLIISLIIYIIMIGVSFPVFQRALKRRCGCTGERHCRYTDFDHEFTKGIAAIFWPVSYLLAAGMLLDSTFSGEERSVRQKRLYEEELARERHATAIAIEKRKQAEQLDLELQAIREENLEEAAPQKAPKIKDIFKKQRR